MSSTPGVYFFIPIGLPVFLLTYSILCVVDTPSEASIAKHSSLLKWTVLTLIGNLIYSEIEALPSIVAKYSSGSSITSSGISTLSLNSFAKS